MDEQSETGRPARRGAGEAVDQLGILVVYHVRDEEDLALLRLHLDRVARHTTVPYTLYAVAHRVTAEARAQLAATPGVVLCDVPATDLRGSREHAHYLDAMVPGALADGASHLVTLDVDSFPVADRWVETLAAAASGGCGLAAILRTENGDVVLPHPACTFADRAFFEEHRPSFSPDWDGTPEFRRFLHTTGQAGDTGIRIAYLLWSRGLDWGRLTRTNAVDVHYLIAGIYGDVVFHLGAGSRGTLFRRDLLQSRVHRITMPIERMPASNDATRRWKRRVLRQARGRAESAFIARNAEISLLVRDWLLSDPDGFLSYLRGEQAAPDAVDRARRLAQVVGTGPRE